MEVDFALLAQSAVVRDLYILDIVAGGIEDLIVPRFPLEVHGLVFVMRLRLHPMEVEHAHEFVLELWDLDGTRLLRTQATMGGTPYHGAPGRSTFIPLVVPLEDLVIPAPGAYSFQVAVDGIHLKSVTFYAESPSTTAT